jgi:hypothetical protein
MDIVYKYIEQDNGDVLLEKIKIDPNIFKLEKMKNGNILLKKKCIIINEPEKICDYNFSKSSILSCSINDKKVDKLKYKSIMVNIFDIINSAKKIKTNTLINICDGEKNDNGYVYYEKLNISIQGTDSNYSLKEILTQCNFNKIKLNMEIELENKQIVYIINE